MTIHTHAHPIKALVLLKNPLLGLILFSPLSINSISQIRKVANISTYVPNPFINPEDMVREASAYQIKHSKTIAEAYYSKLEISKSVPNNYQEFIHKFISLYKGVETLEHSRTDVYLKSLLDIHAIIQSNLSSYDKEVAIEDVTYQANVKFLSQIDISKVVTHSEATFLTNNIEYMKKRLDILLISIDKDESLKDLSTPDKSNKAKVLGKRLIKFIINTLSSKTVAKHLLGFAITLHRNNKDKSGEDIKTFAAFSFEVGRI